MSEQDNELLQARELDRARHAQMQALLTGMHDNGEAQKRLQMREQDCSAFDTEPQQAAAEAEDPEYIAMQAIMQYEAFKRRMVKALPWIAAIAVSIAAILSLKW